MSAESMSAADAAWLGVEQPDNLMVVTGVLRFGERLDRERFAQVVRERMLARYPKFRRLAVPSTGRFRRPRWVDDSGFDLDSHLVTAVLEPDVDGEHALCALVSELLSTPMDMTRSPWQLHIVDGPDDGSTVIARLHHCIGDGIALASVLLSLADAEVADAAPPQHRVSKVAKAGTAARLGVQVVATALRVGLADRDTPSRLHARLGRRKGVAWTGLLDLGAVKKVAGATGVTVNDVLLSVTAGALRRHLVAHGELPHDVRIFVPVDLRPPGRPVPESLGNCFGLVFVRLPLSVADPIERLRIVNARMRRLKSGSEAAATFTILRAVGVAPRWSQRFAVRLLGSKASAVVTNVRGPGDHVAVAGSRLDRVMFWVPQPGSIGLGLSILSYAGSVTVTIAADCNVVPDPAGIAAAVEDELADLTGRLGVHRLS